MDVAARTLLVPILLIEILAVVAIDVWQSGIKGAVWNLGNNLIDCVRWVMGKENGWT